MWKVSQIVRKSPLANAVIGPFTRVLVEKVPGMNVAHEDRERNEPLGGMMKRVKNTAITLVAIFFFGVVFFSVAPAQGDPQISDTAAYYKSKCVACHGQKADKKFDPALTDEQHVDAILKGKKPEKPPNMPAYGDKGVTPDQAKALLEYMKQLRSAQ